MTQASAPPGPTVSIILPTFNRAGSLERAVYSVLEQTYAHFELIIVDDASGDETQALLQTISDSRMQVLRLDVHQGVSAARNTGISHSAAPFIAFQDSDDEWSPQKLALQVERMQCAGPRTGVVYCAFRWQRSVRSGVTPSRARQILASTGLARHRLDGDLQHSLPRGNFITTQSALVKKECLDAAGGFDERLARLGDWDLWMRIAQHYDFSFINRSLVNTYASADGISSDPGALHASFEILLEKYRDQLPVYRQIAAQRHYAIGRGYQAQGSLAPARRQFALALKNSPLTAAYWLAALGGLSGSRRRRSGERRRPGDG